MSATTDQLAPHPAAPPDARPARPLPIIQPTRWARAPRAVRTGAGR